MQNLAHEDAESLLAKIQSLDVSKTLMRKSTDESVDPVRRRRRWRHGRSEGQEAEEDESNGTDSSESTDSAPMIEEETQEQLEELEERNDAGNDSVNHDDHAPKQNILETNVVSLKPSIEEERLDDDVMADDLASADLRNLPLPDSEIPLENEGDSMWSTSRVQAEVRHRPNIAMQHEQQNKLCQLI